MSKVFPVISYREVECFISQDTLQIIRTLLNLCSITFFSVPVDSDLKSGSLSISDILGIGSICIALAIIITTKSNNYIFTSCSLNLVEINLALPSGYIDTK